MSRLRFEPVYYSDKLRSISRKDHYDKEKLNIINNYGTAGIVTLWTKPWEIWEKIKSASPQIASKDSPLVTLTSLYGNGLPQMLANLANNPQIEYLAVTGNDTKSVQSYTYLLNFLEKGVEPPEAEGQLGKIRETQYPLDPQLSNNLFKHLKVQRFPPSDLEGLVNFINQHPKNNPQELDRVKIKLIEPVFSDFPSDLTTHKIHAKTPLSAWTDLIYTLNRFGKNVDLKKGKRRALYKLAVTIDDPSPEPHDLLRDYGFDPKELEAYRESILQGSLQEGMSYTYGNLLREHFGFDTLDEISSRLKKDPMDRRGFVSLWDNKEHLLAKSKSDTSVPCLTDLYFYNLENKLNLTANFRTHNATSAWLLNVYGLRALQEYVSQGSSIEPGRVEVTSRWIGIDPDDAKTNSALKMVEKFRKIKIDVNDPRGYFVIEARGEKIFADHYSPEGSKLRSYQGDSAKEVKDMLRQDAVIANPDHAMWIGYELARAQQKLTSKVEEL